MARSPKNKMIEFGKYTNLSLRSRGITKGAAIEISGHVAGRVQLARVPDLSLYDVRNLAQNALRILDEAAKLTAQIAADARKLT